MIVIITCLVLFGGVWALRKYVFSPNNPFPDHAQYTDAWDMLDTPSQKRAFLKNFGVIKRDTYDVVDKVNKRTYKLLVCMSNGTDVFNVRCNAPTMWAADFFTVEAAVRESAKKGQSIFTSEKEFLSLIDLFPQKDRAEKLKCFVALFGLKKHGRFHIASKMILDSKDYKAGQIIVAIHTNLLSAYSLYFDEIQAFIRPVSHSEIHDAAHVTLVSIPLEGIVCYEK